MPSRLEPLHWPTDGRDWPNRERSRFVGAGGLAWHVQEAGSGPRLLLIHGTGASTHSYRDLFPRLASSFEVLSLDLPGHAFTAAPRPDGQSLAGMTRLVALLCRGLSFEPAVVVGHSAGAAVAAALALNEGFDPRLIVSLNGALLPIEGVAVLAPLAKLLFLNPFAPRLFAWRGANASAVRRLLEGTGSSLDDRGIELYRRLFSHSGHVAATLGMMAHWEPAWLAPRLGELRPDLLVVTGAKDRAVRPAQGAEIAAKARRGRLEALAFGGHLVHEERPDAVAGLIVEAARRAGVLAPAGAPQDPPAGRAERAGGKDGRP